MLNNIKNESYNSILLRRSFRNSPFWVSWVRPWIHNLGNFHPDLRQHPVGHNWKESQFSIAFSKNRLQRILQDPLYYRAVEQFSLSVQLRSARWPKIIGARRKICICISIFRFCLIFENISLLWLISKQNRHWLYILSGNTGDFGNFTAGIQGNLSALMADFT